MITAKGFGAWHNQFNTLPPEQYVSRAVRAKLDFVIVKWGDPRVEDAYAAAGIHWATERYVYINQPVDEGHRLANAIDAGAAFAVINAEEGEGGWGPGELGGQAMKIICETFLHRHPGVPLYACLDTRGDRLQHPYQRVALEVCDGIIPMIYPGAFYPAQPQEYIGRAFEASTDGKDFGGKPIFPAIQSYGWDWPPGSARRLGPAGIREQLLCVLGIGASGCQLYTIHHASEEEWDEVVRLREGGIPKPPEPTPAPGPSPLEEELAWRRAAHDLVVLAADRGRWPFLAQKLIDLGVKPK